MAQGDSERHLTNDDLNALSYLECVIKESQRIFPPVPMFGRETSEKIEIGTLKVFIEFRIFKIYLKDLK